MISIIIPIYNEEKILHERQEYFRSLSKHGQLIFVDAGSEDNSCKLATSFGQVCVAETKGRSYQMNVGALAAKNPYLIFLHADTRVEPSKLFLVNNALDSGYIIGCFSQKIDHSSIIYAWIALTGNVRARLSQIYYGDQGIFVRQDVFEDIGGFPEVLIAEDVLFSKKVKEKGRGVVLKEKILCSARRWENGGLFKTFLLNFRVHRALLLGKRKDKLAEEYQDVR